MKQTISTILGLLRSYQLSVTITVSRRPLDRLLVSSIITGYTLWNAKYRMFLMRNFDIAPYDRKGSNCPTESEVPGQQSGEDRKIESGFNLPFKDSECCNPHLFAYLSPEALNYIQKLQSELTLLEKNDVNPNFMEQSVERNSYNQADGYDEFCDKVDTSRNYLAKLLFWLVLLISPI